MTGTQHRRRSRSKGRATAHPESLANSTTTNNETGTDTTTEVEILPEHRESGTKTHEFNRSVKVKRDYINRLMKMQKWMQEKYPSHYKDIVFDISEQDLKSRTRFYYKMKRDIKYDRLNYNVWEAFMGDHKMRTDETHYSYSNMRKYYDALLYGAEQSKHYLTPRFTAQADTYIECLKKEKTNAKKAGNLSIEDADPITQALYLRILFWAVEAGNMFVWAYTVLCWNCMARSISIENLGLRNCKLGALDSVQWKYDDSKADKTGIKLTPKNCYANPFNFLACSFTSIGIWISLNRDRYNRGDKLFVISGTEGTTAHNYAESLKNLLSDKHDEIIAFGTDPYKAKPHGFRKGAGTAACSGTTAAPSLPSVANRGEWSQGGVFNIYLQFAAAGDHYLGRLLAALDPNDPMFGVLPPHFKVGYDNEDVKKFMFLCFGDMLIKFDEEATLLGVLLLFGASIAYHANELKAVAAGKSNHPFSTLPMFSDLPLLERVRSHITLQPSNNICAASGVPPHIKMMDMLNESHNLLHESHRMFSEICTRVEKCVQDAIEANDVRSGKLTLTTLEQYMKSLRTDLLSDIGKKLDEYEQLSDEVYPPPPIGHDGSLFANVEPPLYDVGQGATDTNARSDIGVLSRYNVYHHTDGKFYDVPEGYNFPTRTNRRNGWICWVLGQPSYQFRRKKRDGTEETINAPIRPFHMMNIKRLPKKLQNTYRTNWRVLFKLMQGDERIQIPESGDIAVYLESTYASGTNRIKEKAPFFFEATFKSNHETWTVSTWARNLSKKVMQDWFDKAAARGSSGSTTQANTSVQVVAAQVKKKPRGFSTNRVNKRKEEREKRKLRNQRLLEGERAPTTARKTPRTERTTVVASTTTQEAAEEDEHKSSNKEDKEDDSSIEEPYFENGRRQLNPKYIKRRLNVAAVAPGRLGFYSEENQGRIQRSIYESSGLFTQPFQVDDISNSETKTDEGIAQVRPPQKNTTAQRKTQLTLTTTSSTKKKTASKTSSVANNCNKPKRATQQKCVSAKKTPRKRTAQTKVTNANKTSRKEQTKTVNDNFASSFGHVQVVAPQRLQQTGAGTFYPTTCTECNNMQNQHRCKVPVETGGYYTDVPTNAFCGRAFCVPCALKRGCEFGDWKCEAHQGFKRSVGDEIDI